MIRLGNTASEILEPRSLVRRAMERCLLATAVCALAATPGAKAATYDAFAGFSASNPSGTWAYGEGVTGTSFKPFTIYHSSGCVTVAGLACWEPPITTLYSPDVSKNMMGSNFWGTTFLVPDNVLRIHPDTSSDVVVQWTAPSAGNYSVAGLFELLDSAPTGITGEVYDGRNQVYRGVLNGPPASEANLSPGGRESFSLIETLKAGDVLSFGVNNNGDFLGDSTGFDVTIAPASAPAPEPRTFLPAGLGLILLECFRKNGITDRPSRSR